jgi:hypothetical protein
VVAAIWPFSQRTVISSAMLLSGSGRPLVSVNSLGKIRPSVKVCLLVGSPA